MTLLAEGVPPGQHREVLVHDRIAEGAHDLPGIGPRLDQIDDIGLREHPALRGDLVQLIRIELESGDLLRGESHLDHALVDGGASTAGALVVHGAAGLFPPGLGIDLKDDDLGILTTQFDHASGIRMEVLDGQGDRIDLLDEESAGRFDQWLGSGTRDEKAGRVDPLREALLDRDEQFQGHLGLPGLVPSVAAPDDFPGRGIETNGFHGGRTHVETDEKSTFPVPRLSGFGNLAE